MSRNRVRRSFTVETKARGRQAPAFLPVRAPLLGSEPARPAQRLFEALLSPADERAEPRRILPNLIATPAVEAEPAPVREPEPRLPRVRRVSARRPAREAEIDIRARPEPALPVAAAEVVPALGGIQVSPEDALSSGSVPIAAGREPRRSRREDETLRLGERWKRRLPRVCW